MKNRKSDTQNQFSYLKISNFDNLPYSLGHSWYQDKIALQSFILQQKPASEDQNLFKQELDDQLSKWQSTQTSIHCLQNKHFELTQKIKSAYRLILIKKGEENKNEKPMQEAKETTNEKETVKQKISFLIAASQILTIRRINFDIQGCQDKMQFVLLSSKKDSL